MVAWRYEFYFVMLQTTFDSLAALVRKILFSPLENKIYISAPPCNILYVSFMEMTNVSLCIVHGNDESILHLRPLSLPCRGALFK